MMSFGSPLSRVLTTDPDIAGHFWYWTGKSGRRYIHSVYALEDCPPLPGAIYVAVRREGAMRIVMGVGRFTPFWHGPHLSLNHTGLRATGISEIHVHLLAKSPENAEAILADLISAFEEGAQADNASGGFAEEQQQLMAA